MSAPRLLHALQSNGNLRPNELGEIASKLSALETRRAGDRVATETDAPDEVIESAVTKYLEENAAEVAAEKDKPFQPIGMALEDAGAEAADEPVPPVASVTSSADSAAKEAASAVPVPARKPLTPARPQEERRDSSLQKISKLDIRGRIALAMRGNKEERSILIRDSTKLVSLAVLDSPKLSEAEVEKFALQKN